jgi:hypothetical protein
MMLNFCLKMVSNLMVKNDVINWLKNVIKSVENGPLKIDQKMS